ncbi:MAG: glycosyltransferase family 1 protein [Bryobacterales bacterium]|nr:glycosyltransferase family 1 protein [Bryobacterales bacterium]
MPEPRSAVLPPAVSSQSALLQPDSMKQQVRVLALVHLRNIHRSTGAGRVARQLIEHLAERPDIELQVLADPGDHARIVNLVGRPWSDFQYRFFAKETSRQQAEWFLLDRPHAERYWSEAQIMFCTAESYVPVRHARLVITLHDAAYFESNAHRIDCGFVAQRLKWSLLYRKMGRRADLFHTVSQFSAERLAHFFPALRGRLRVVPNAVTPHFFEPVSVPGNEYLDTEGLRNRPFVLVPGGLHFRKNADVIFDGWPLLKRLHPDLQLIVVNHSSPDYMERARQFGPDFRVIGFVSDHALRALYGAAQCVWFPSRYEGFGLPVVEAMACGAAVVASRASSLPEIAGNAALLAQPQDAADHVERIDAVLRSESLRADLGRRGVERARQYTWSESARQMKDLFEGLL